MKRRRRNQAPRRIVPFALGAAGAIAGVGLGYWIATTREAQEAADELFKNWRLPQPDFRVHIPETPNDYQRIDDEICECAEPMLEEAADDADLSVVVDEIVLCITRRLHPDLEWPPVPGDHPSAKQLWLEIAAMVRRAIITDTFCDRAVLPSPIPIPEPTQ